MLISSKKEGEIQDEWGGWQSRVSSTLVLTLFSLRGSTDPPKISLKAMGPLHQYSVHLQVRRAPGGGQMDWTAA